MFFLPSVWMKGNATGCGKLCCRINVWDLFNTHYNYQWKKSLPQSSFSFFQFVKFVDLFEIVVFLFDKYRHTRSECAKISKIVKWLQFIPLTTKPIHANDQQDQYKRLHRINLEIAHGKATVACRKFLPTHLPVCETPHVTIFSGNPVQQSSLICQPAQCVSQTTSKYWPKKCRQIVVSPVSSNSKNTVFSKVEELKFERFYSLDKRMIRLYSVFVVHSWGSFVTFDIQNWCQFNVLRLMTWIDRKW